MLVNLLFLAVISSGSFLCSIKFNKKYEELLPVTCMGIGFVLFLSGMIGYLKIGAVLVFGIAAVLYALAVVEAAKNKDGLKITSRKFVNNFFSVGFFCFIIIYFILSVSLEGLLAKEWDDFSHWTDIIKAMTTMNDFGTNPESYSLFNSYPPAMALFQYLLQKINRFCGSGETFSEWRCFFAYQVYFISIIMPALKDSKHKRVIPNITFMAVVLLTPLMFFDFVYNSSKIDPFLAMLASAGLYSVISKTKEEKDIFYSIYIWLILTTLVLSKDSGAIFAIFIAIIYVIDICLNHFTTSKLYAISMSMSAFFAIIVPKMLWKLHLKITQVQLSFSNKIEADVLWNVLRRKDDSYRSDVLKSFFQALFEKRILLGLTGIEVNYFTIIIVEVFLVALTVFALYKRNSFSMKHMYLYNAGFIIMLFSYILGMCVLYMFKFTEAEALELASLERYLGTIFMAGALLAFCLIWKLFSECRGLLLLLVTMILIGPVDEFVNVFNGTNIEEAAYVREGPSYLTRKIIATCNGNDKICLINQDGTGQENLIIKFEARPNVVIAKSKSEMKSMTDEIWEEDLVSNFDYVAIYRYDDDFVEKYGCMFEDPDDISSHGLYMIDKENRILYQISAGGE